MATTKLIPDVPGKVEQITNSKFLSFKENDEIVLGPFDTRDSAAEAAVDYWEESDLNDVVIYEVIAKFSVSRTGFKFTQEKL